MKKRLTPKTTFLQALKEGSGWEYLSAAVWGAGCAARGQIIKGLLFLAAEAGVIGYMLSSGLYNLDKLMTLGTVGQQKVWNDEKSIFEYIDGDRSLNILLYGIITVAILICGIMLLRASVKASYRAGSFKKQGKRAPGFRRELRAYADERLHMTLLTPPLLGICAFTLLPLVFMACMAFTNYSVLDKKLVLFDWVGLKNFERTLALNGSLGQTFWSVLGWTILWALAATFSNYILGMLLAVPTFAVMVAFPFFLAVTFPFLVTVATDLLLDDQLTFFLVPVIFRVIFCPVRSVTFFLEIFGAA